jgi:lysine 2,3-aminomutase
MSSLAIEELDTQHVDPPELVAGNIDVAEVSTPGTPDLQHSDRRADEFWRQIPGFAHVSAAEFHTHTFQARHTATNIRQIKELLRDRASESFFEDVALGVERAPMALRISPYILSLIDWNDPRHDPIRTQFLPLASQQLPNHPELRLDSLAERRDSSVPGLTHRYRDKALFLPILTCPVYCRFCTRSYAIGGDTGTVEKLKLSGMLERRETAFRYATKGLAVMPQKILTDNAWLDALTSVVELGRKLHKDVVVHTHFNHPNEITCVTRGAMNRLTERGITVRCQTVLQNGVNNDSATMQLLVRRLGFINIHPYYVYFHDMVPGVEDLRTSLDQGLRIEKHVRGTTAGFNTPSFVVDTMGGGGKRDAHSFERYNRETGTAVFTSPSVKPGARFLYFDPIRTLDQAAQRRWNVPEERKRMIDDALEATI